MHARAVALHFSTENRTYNDQAETTTCASYSFSSFMRRSQPEPNEILSMHIYVLDDPEPGHLLHTPKFDLQSQLKRKGQQNIQ